MLFSELLPGVFGEEQKQREQLQPACQHIKNEDQLGKIGKHRKVPGGPHQLQAGADIIHRGRHRRKVCDHVQVVKGDEQQRNGEDHNVDDEKNVGGTDDFMLRG